MKGRFFSAATLAMARLVAEFVPPTSMSRLFWSNHSLARAEATSALFWWSATSSSIFLPLISPPASAIAMRMASAPPGPSTSEYTPDMSVMKPMRMTSSLMPCAAPRPENASRPVPRTALVVALRRSVRARMMAFLLGSNAQKSVEFRLSGLELGGSDVVHGLAVLHDVKAVCQRGSEVKVLLDHDDGVALGFQGENHARQRLDDDGRQAFRNLVEQEQVRARAKDAGHGKHLLFASRQPGSLGTTALEQVGEHLVNFVETHAAGVAVADCGRQQ